MSRKPELNTKPQDAGFTIVELLVVSVVGILLVMGAYQLLVTQSRVLTTQQETIDAQESTRGAAALLAWELRSAAASGGDLYVITQDSVVLRSVRATGVICSWVEGSGQSKYGLRQTSGTFTGTANDSAMVFSVVDNTWAAFDVSAAWTGSAAWTNTPVCFWGDSTTSVPRPEASIQIDTLATLANLEVGGPVHLFRKTTYGLSTLNGRWWLSRKEGAGGWEILTGPMLSPSDGGLAFAYYDSLGAVTTDPTLVTRVEFTLRSESYGKVSMAGQAGHALKDSITASVFLRNTS